MNAEEKQYFEELTKIRSNGADVLAQSFLSGIWEGIIEKYSDQAHFIYELLQNADDVGATYANFSLFKDKLVFKHNGTRHFHVSNPKTERSDKENGHLGDLNSISSAAQSAKKGKDSIGKFGVGFKAVFQYTETPHIYDPNVAFIMPAPVVIPLTEAEYLSRKIKPQNCTLTMKEILVLQSYKIFTYGEFIDTAEDTISFMKDKRGINLGSRFLTVHKKIKADYERKYKPVIPNSEDAELLNAINENKFKD